MTTMLGPAVDGAGVDLGDELAGLFDPETGTMRTSLLVPAPGPVVIPEPPVTFEYQGYTVTETVITYGRKVALTS